MEDCEEDCGACSGELCMSHDGPCECDTAERHEDVHGVFYYGRWDGMHPYPDAEILGQ